MSQYKKKLPRITTPKGEIRYYFLNKPKTQFNPEGTLECLLVLTREEAAPLIEQLSAILDETFEEKHSELEAKGKEYKAKAKTLVKAAFYKPEYDEEGEETGRLIFKFKQNRIVRNKAGQEFIHKVIHLLGNGQEFTPGSDFCPANGCKVRLNIEVAPYYTPKDNAVGVTLRPKVVKFLTYVPYAGGVPSDMMGEEDESEFTEYTPSMGGSEDEGTKAPSTYAGSGIGDF